MIKGIQVTVKRCCCGSEYCSDYWLVGVGRFVQGSGFRKEDAEKIARLLNEDAQQKGGDDQ